MLRLKSRSSDTVRHVWTQDPALDAEHPDMDYEKYLDTGDEAFLRVKDGQSLTYFELAPLTRQQDRYIGQLLVAKRHIDAVHETVAYCLKNIVGIEIDGRPFVIQTEKGEHGPRMTKESMDATYDLSLWTELAGRVREVSRLHPL